ncbi:hypothetical protein BKA69DRAFT_91714 [Paraphysoderma sedebokerense]|nr:hypothetical protein BKA69DRAFT_91714 [Paraphysoderma sedebokerense]
MSKSSKSRDNCCCCIPIKPGVIVLTCLYLIGSLGQLISSIQAVQALEALKAMSPSAVANSAVQFIRGASGAWYAPYIAVALIDIFACLLGLWSINKARVSAFKIYFGWRVIHVIFLAVMTAVEIAQFAQVMAMLKAASAATTTAVQNSGVDLSALNNALFDMVAVTLIPLYVAMAIAVVLTIYFLVVHKRYLNIMQDQ